MRLGGRQVSSSALGPFPCAMGIVGFVPARSVRSRVPWGGGGCRVSLCAFGPFPCALGDRRVRTLINSTTPRRARVNPRDHE